MVFLDIYWTRKNPIIIGLYPFIICPSPFTLDAKKPNKFRATGPGIMAKGRNLFRNNSLFNGRIEADNNRVLINPIYIEENH